MEMEEGGSLVGFIFYKNIGSWSVRCRVCRCFFISCYLWVVGIFVGLWGRGVGSRVFRIWVFNEVFNGCKDLD